MRETIRVGIQLGACILLLTTSVASGADFDDGTLQGWTVGADGFSLTNPGSGGNPGGYLLLTDLVAGGSGGTVEAPVGFTGDLTGFSFLTWDAILPAAATTPVRVALVAPGGTYIFTPSGPIVSGIWESKQAPLIESGWSLFSGTASFIDVQSNVTRLAFLLEVATTIGPEAGIDNVNLVPVPEPSAAFLLGLGLLGLAVSRQS